MALYHRATLTPTKDELLARWVPTQDWGPGPTAEPIETIGSYRFDDPEGRVGMESFLVRSGDALYHVPLTYRDEPLAGAEDALISEMEHSALGTRWVYDGLGDPRLVVMLAAVSMTGQGEALGMVAYDDRWYTVPSKVRIQGGGWTQGRAAVDGFTSVDSTTAWVVLRNDRFDLTVWRRPTAGPRPEVGLTAHWDGQPEPMVLAEVSER